jgi:Cu2+-containing amine oxidase
MIRGRDADNGEIWALQYSDLENWSSWGGTQNKIPGSPGSVPAIYANNQSLQNTDIVIWYLAHVLSHDLAEFIGR